MEDVRRRIDIKLMTTPKQIKKHANKVSYKRSVVFINDEKNECETWHAEQVLKGEKWNFKKELLEYCFKGSTVYSDNNCSMSPPYQL